jgi:hypothetical protein
LKVLLDTIGEAIGSVPLCVEKYSTIPEDDGTRVG